jgi:hypothetical protein
MHILEQGLQHISTISATQNSTGQPRQIQNRTISNIKFRTITDDHERSRAVTNSHATASVPVVLDDAVEHDAYATVKGEMNGGIMNVGDASNSAVINQTTADKSVANSVKPGGGGLLLQDPVVQPGHEEGENGDADGDVDGGDDADIEETYNEAAAAAHMTDDMGCGMG